MCVYIHTLFLSFGIGDKNILILGKKEKTTLTKSFTIDHIFIYW